MRGLEKGGTLGVNPKSGTKGGEDAFVLWVRVKPRARADEIVGWGREGFLEVQVRAVPERGEANRSCCRLLARLLDVPASRVSLERGPGSTRKKFRVQGMTRLEGEKVLERALGPKGTGSSA